MGEETCYVFLYNMRVRKLLLENSDECSGNCRECARCLRLLRCDAEDNGRNSECRTEWSRDKKRVISHLSPRWELHVSK